MNILTRPALDEDAEDRAWDANAMQRDWADKLSELAANIDLRAGTWSSLVTAGIAGWPPGLTPAQREQLLEDLTVFDERLRAMVGL